MVDFDETVKSRFMHRDVSIEMHCTYRDSLSYQGIVVDVDPSRGVETTAPEFSSGNVTRYIPFSGFMEGIGKITDVETARVLYSNDSAETTFTTFQAGKDFMISDDLRIDTLRKGRFEDF